MAGGDRFSDHLTPAAMLDLVHGITGISLAAVLFRKDCTNLVPRIVLLAHFLAEVRDFESSTAQAQASSSAPYPRSDWVADLAVALQATMHLLSAASSFNAVDASDGAAKRILFQFQCVTMKLENSLGKIPFDCYDISEEVQEQVVLVRRQLKRASERYRSTNFRKVSCGFSLQQDKETIGEVSTRLDSFKITPNLDDEGQENLERRGSDGPKKNNALVSPEDFLCPISLELMKDPVIVSTGQTYERTYIQRWIKYGYLTCPKTQQKLENLTLTPNYVLKSLISQWYAKQNIKQPVGLANGKLVHSDGSSHDVCGDMSTIQALVRKLSSQCQEEHRAAAAEVRLLSKSTDNRILIAEAGAIPVLINLLATEDKTLQENAVTAILNLSIYENNKSAILLAGAIPSVVRVVRSGSMEARENAAATLFSLSLAAEHRETIGVSGALPALVELLQNGSLRGKKDAATALYNLCLHQYNKGRAVRAGIITVLLKMLMDLRNFMVDEALAILVVLVSNSEAKVSMVKAGYIPVLIDLLRRGLPRNKESAASILLALCKRNPEVVGCLSRLGAVIPLMELARSGTERGKRKATSLLELLCK